MDPQSVVGLQGHKLVLLRGVLAENEHSHVIAILVAHALRRQLVVHDVVLRRHEIVHFCKLVEFHYV